MLEHDETEPRTPHDSRDEPTVDDQETFPGAAQVKSAGSLDLTFLVADACVSIKIHIRENLGSKMGLKRTKMYYKNQPITF